MTRLRPAPGLAVIEEAGVVYAATMPDGPILVLSGGAAAIWIEACAGERASIADRVAEGTGVPVATIRADIEGFVDDLLGRALLVPDPK